MDSERGIIELLPALYVTIQEGKMVYALYQAYLTYTKCMNEPISEYNSYMKILDLIRNNSYFKTLIEKYDLENSEILKILRDSLWVNE